MARRFSRWQIAAGIFGAFSSRQAQQNIVPDQLDSQVERLQQSVDTIALEVERIGEGQRFINKLQQEQSEREPLKRNPTSGSEGSGQ